MAATVATLVLVSAFLFRDQITAPTTSTSLSTTTVTIPPTTSTIPPVEAAEAVSMALETAGYEGISAVVVGGVLFLDGLIPPGRLEQGVFAYVDGAVGVAERAAPGVTVRSRLRVRGDTAVAARQLRSLTDASPILFASGSATLDQTHLPTLDKVAEVVKANPGVVVLVGGHTDPSGSVSANQRLARERAQAVIDYLISRGLPPARFAIIAYGELLELEDPTAHIVFEVAP